MNQFNKLNSQKPNISAVEVCPRRVFRASAKVWNPAVECGITKLWTQKGMLQRII